MKTAKTVKTVKAVGKIKSMEHNGRVIPVVTMAQIDTLSDMAQAEGTKVETVIHREHGKQNAAMDFRAWLESMPLVSDPYKERTFATVELGLDLTTWIRLTCAAKAKGESVEDVLSEFVDAHIEELDGGSLP